MDGYAALMVLAAFLVCCLMECEHRHDRYDECLRRHDFAEAYCKRYNVVD